MALTAKSIIHRATDILQDKTSIRWLAGELVRWLNDGQREVAAYRPDAFRAFTPITLVAGARQTLPSGAVKLIDVPSNAGVDRTVVRQVPRRALDEQQPGWRNLPEVAVVKHFVYDVRDPLAFEVYPPARTGATVNALYAVYPTDIAEPAPGADWTGVVGDISTQDIFGNALLDYVLYRAYLKDSDYAGNIGRSQGHYAAFASVLGIEVKATQAIAPVTAHPGEAGAIQ